MRTQLVGHAVAAIGLATVAVAALQETSAPRKMEGGQEFRLTFTAVEGIEFPFETNAEAGGGGCAPPRMTDLGRGKTHDTCIPLAPQEIAVEPEPNKIHVDTDGDGKPDEVIKGTEGPVTFKLLYPDGEKSSYAVRLYGDGDRTWTFNRWCYMSGKVHGTTVVLIDENCNGLYGDLGVDRIVVGDGAFAHPLSPIVSLGGELYELEVERSGTRVRTRPYAGETGILDLTSEFRSKGKLLSAVVRNGSQYFDVGSRAGVKVPAGEYRLYSGAVSATPQLAHLRQGRMPSFQVEAGKTVAVEWGTPVSISFTHEFADRTVTIRPEAIHVLGESGEEYFAFKPMAFTPTVVVRDMRANSVVQKGTMWLG